VLRTVPTGEKLNKRALEQILYNLLIDLQCERLIRKRVLKTGVSLASGKKTGAINPQILAEVGDQIAELAANLGLQLAIQPGGAGSGQVQQTTVINPYQHSLEGMITDFDSAVDILMDGDATGCLTPKGAETPLLATWDLNMEESGKHEMGPYEDHI